MAWFIRSAIGVAMVVLSVATPGTASADPRKGGPAFHGSVGFGVRHPYPHVWHGGYWNHSWRDGRLGWWWVADGYWYPYAEPIYPYPAYPYPAYPYPTYVPPPAPIIAPPPGPPPAQTWYACDDPQGYYPYVTQCNVPWRQVPVTPPK